MKEIKAPNQIPVDKSLKIFLGGTIDMGSSEDWQTDFKRALENKIKGLRYNSNVTLLNPRRDSWDNSWIQEFNNPQFFQQVTWEIDAMDKADIIIINFLPDSKSPISLLELGLYAKSKKILVCCPDEFYRSGNVQIVCNRFNIPLYKTMEELINKGLTYKSL